MKNIILLPGLASDETIFQYQNNMLSRYYKIQIIVCDKHQAMHKHVEYILNQAPEHFILLGHSFGGWIAQWVSILAPKRVKGLILLATDTGGLSPVSQKYFQEMLQHAEQNKAKNFLEKMRSELVYARRKHDIRLMNILKNMHDNFSKQGLINQAKTGLEAKDSLKFLSDITCETLLIQGENDSSCAQEMKLLNDHIRGSNYQEIKKCGHTIPLEKPKILFSVVQNWIHALPG